MDGLTPALIPEDVFTDHWGAHAAPSGDLFRYEEVAGKPLRTVWTVVETGDDEDGSWYALPGFRVVNALGYVLTTREWADDTPDAVWFLDDFD